MRLFLVSSQRPDAPCVQKASGALWRPTAATQGVVDAPYYYYYYYDEARGVSDHVTSGVPEPGISYSTFTSTQMTADH